MKNWEIKVKISVAESWVIDGFDMAQRLEEVEELLTQMLPYAYGYELNIKATLIKSPSLSSI